MDDNVLEPDLSAEFALFFIGAIASSLAGAIAYFVHRKKLTTVKPALYAVRAVPWYRPVPLAVTEDAGAPRIIGKIHGPKLYLTRNVHHGWMVFAEQQTKDNLSRCECCGSLTKTK